MKKKIVVIALLFLMLIGIVYICFFQNLKDNKKGGEGQGMFEKGSESITIYSGSELIHEFKGTEKDKLVNLLKKSDWDNFNNVVYNDKYSIELDFNNNIAKLYLNIQDKKCFLKDKGKQYTLSNEAYDFIISYVQEEEKN